MTIDRTENIALIKQLTDEMAKVLPVKHTASAIHGAVDDRAFVGALVIETKALEGGSMLLIKLWDDGEFELKTTNETGESCLEQVKAIWAEQRGLTDGQI